MELANYCVLSWKLFHKIHSVTWIEIITILNKKSGVKSVALIICKGLNILDNLLQENKMLILTYLHRWV